MAEIRTVVGAMLDGLAQLSDTLLAADAELRARETSEDRKIRLVLAGYATAYLTNSLLALRKAYVNLCLLENVVTRPAGALTDAGTRANVVEAITDEATALFEPAKARLLKTVLTMFPFSDMRNVRETEN